MKSWWSLEGYARVLSGAVRFLMFLFLLCGLTLLVIAFFDHSKWLFSVALGLPLSAVGVAAFFAKPISADQIRPSSVAATDSNPSVQQGSGDAAP